MDCLVHHGTRHSIVHDANTGPAMDCLVQYRTRHSIVHDAKSLDQPWIVWSTMEPDTQ